MTLDTPLGTLHFWSSPKGLAAAYFDDATDAIARRIARFDLKEGADRSVHRAFDAYFHGEPMGAKELAHMHPLGTNFEQRVWRALGAISPGETRSYGELARELGSAPRAVGGAAGRNPIMVGVPCHRLVGADGGLRGYAYGLERKAWLLQHERLPH